MGRFRVSHLFNKERTAGFQGKTCVCSQALTAAPVAASFIDNMSHDGFHVHGPDQHELEHQAAHGDGLAVRVSIMTAILATFGAVFSYLGSAQQTAAADCKNDAILAKNEAIQLRTQAANQWAFYQSKSTKQNLAELAQELAADAALRAKYATEIARYQAEKAAIKAQAEGLEKRADDMDAKVDPLVRRSSELMHPHHVLAQAITLIQIGIALASICALTKVRALFWASAAASTAGLLLAIWAWLPHGGHAAPGQANAAPAAETAGGAGK
jgi:hypothetical protein